MSLDMRAEVNRLLGPIRAERARWLLARLAGDDDPASPEELSEVLRATVLDWGFARDAGDGLGSLERLLRAWCAHLAARGITHLSLFASHASPAAPLVRSLAESIVDVEFQCTLPEPANAAEHGLHVDPVYY